VCAQEGKPQIGAGKSFEGCLIRNGLRLMCKQTTY
jgi:hypothetical protein